METMTKEEIYNAILKHLYDNWLHSRGGSIFSLLPNLDGVDEKTFERVAEDMEEDGLIGEVGQSVPCEITPVGISEAESRNLVDPETKKANEDTRSLILEKAYELRETEGRSADVNLDDLNGANIFDNASFLEKQGLIDFVSMRSISITKYGRRLYEDNIRLAAEPIVARSPAFETASSSYQIVGPSLGEGGVGRVHEVRDQDGQTFALKVMHPAVISTEKVKRFRNELRFLARNTHVNFVEVTDEGFVMHGEDKIPFYVMRKYDKTLRQLMQDPMTGEKILSYFVDVLNGVEALHLTGSYHRDLKPENILYDGSEDRLLIADFGAAHFAEDWLHTLVETNPRSRLANVEYAAPEQRKKGEKVTQLVDVYALGLILHELYTGRTPQGLGYKKIGDVSPGYAYLDDIVTRMIQHSPSNRFQTIEEIKIRLKAAENEFVSLQRLDTLRKTVVPIGELSDPLTFRPVTIVDRDFFDETFRFHLSTPVNADWISGFKNIDDRNHGLYHAWPQDMNISGDLISLSTIGAAKILKHDPKLVGSLVDKYVGIANQRYKQLMEDHAIQAEANLIQAQKIANEQLLERIRREEEMQRIRKAMNE
jgi:eukaryotic-like serine/threonine-protein kinase